jgi:hypothetical protein
VDTLVFVHGFDIALDDLPRWRHAEGQFRRTCDELGRRAVVVRTNLRKHPAFRGIPWERAHGAALMAVGHALSSAIGTLVIPPSYRASDQRPWGSDHRTDPLHSTSRLRVLHKSEPVGRPGRIARIAANPIVQRSLRVCWENREPTGNCSRCEKCLLTMAVLAGVGHLDDFEVFDRTTPLVEQLDALPGIAQHARLLWQETLELQRDPDLADALERLLRRQPPAPPAHERRAGTRMRRRVARLFRRR